MQKPKSLESLSADQIADEWINSKDTVSFYNSVLSSLPGIPMRSILESCTSKGIMFGILPDHLPYENFIYMAPSGSEVRVFSAITDPDVFLHPERFYGYPVNFVGLVVRYIRKAPRIRIIHSFPEPRPIYAEPFSRPSVTLISLEKESMKNDFRAIRYKNFSSQHPKYNFRRGKRR